MIRRYAMFSALAFWMAFSGVRADESGDPSDIARTPPEGVGEFAAGVVVHVAGGVHLLQTWLTDAGESVPAPGDLLHPGDVLATDADGELEIVWGVNVRLRLGRSSRISIVSGAAPAPPDPAVDAPTAGVGRALWRLWRGTARVRVRENILYPASLLLAFSSHNLVTIRRGDAAMRLDASGPQVWVGAGGVEIASPAWRGELSAGESFSGDKVVPWRGGGISDWVADLAFSVDRANELLPP